MPSDLLVIEFGAMSPPLKKQVKGLKYPVMFQGHADAISRLNVHGLLTDAETKKARERLMDAINISQKRKKR